MFDIGFWELAIIGIVALLVIGPERLPAVARTLGFWLGKARKFVSSVQDDFNREVVKSEELKRLMEEQSKIRDVHEIIEHTVDDTRKNIAVGANLNKEQSATAQLPTEQNAASEAPAQADLEGHKQANKQATSTPSSKQDSGSE